jgi:hypothetical protein
VLAVFSSSQTPEAAEGFVDWVHRMGEKARMTHFPNASEAASSHQPGPVAVVQAQARAHSPQALAPLAALVVKTGVHLGGLSASQRAWALAVPALALPEGGAVPESQVNAVLKACLLAQGSFLDTDHVELRRWLVDTGWWMRDGFGRRYERVPTQSLGESLRPVAQVLQDLDLSAWVAGCRAAVQAERDRRRRVWVEARPQR